MRIHYREALTSVLLMKLLQSRPQRDVRIWVAQCVHSFPYRPKWRSVNGPKLQGPLQKKQWRSRSSSCKFRWLENSRSQFSQWELRILKQSSICSRGAGSDPLNGSRRVRDENKIWKETQRILQKFLEPERKPKVICTDNSLEFGEACEDLSWNHCTSTPHRSDTYGIAERAVCKTKEGTSAVLLQLGPNESWWTDSMECYTYLRNATDSLSDGKTPYERRFGHTFKGPIVPFGSLVEYHPITAKDQSRIHQLGKKVLPGLFLGYALYAGELGRMTYWSQTMDASEIFSKRLNAKEVTFSQRRRIYFSTRRWTNQNLWRRSGLENILLGAATTNSKRNMLTYPELLIRIWMSSKRSALMIIGISMGLETWLILGQVSLLDEQVPSDWRENSSHLGQIINGQCSGN